MKIVEIYPDATIFIFFSEPLILMKDQAKITTLKDIVSVKNEILNITYVSKMDKEDPNRPKLTNWTLSKWSFDEIVIKLNFTNELYVSSMYDADLVEI
jgi:hypothetical protein